MDVIYPDQWCWEDHGPAWSTATQLAPHGQAQMSLSASAYPVLLGIPSTPPFLANTFLTLKTLLKHGFLGEASLSPEAEHITHTPLSSRLGSTTFYITDLISGLYTLLAGALLQAIISLTLRRLQLRGAQANTEVQKGRRKSRNKQMGL